MRFCEITLMRVIFRYIYKHSPQFYSNFFCIYTYAYAQLSTLTLWIMHTYCRDTFVSANSCRRGEERKTFSQQRGAIVRRSVVLTHELFNQPRIFVQFTHIGSKRTRCVLCTFRYLAIAHEGSHSYHSFQRFLLCAYVMRYLYVYLHSRRVEKSSKTYLGSIPRTNPKTYSLALIIVRLQRVYEKDYK